MPKELFQLGSREYSKYMSGGMTQIKTVESNMAHHTYLYYINPANTNTNLICDNCNNKAEFLLYDDDHMKQVYISLWCEEHAPAQFKNALEER